MVDSLLNIWGVSDGLECRLCMGWTEEGREKGSGNLRPFIIDMMYFSSESADPAPWKWGMLMLGVARFLWYKLVQSERSCRGRHY